LLGISAKKGESDFKKKRERETSTKAGFSPLANLVALQRRHIVGYRWYVGI
jgi:hypothetical protein